MNNYNPYDPNQNQSYGDPQNTITGQGTESTYSQGGGQEQNTQPYHGQTQGDSTYHYSYQSPYQNVVNTTATPVTGSAPVPPSKKKEKKPRYLSRKAAAVFMALVILAAGGLGVGGGILGYQLAKGSGSGSGVNITTVQPSSGENTNAVNYTGDSMSVSDVAAMTSPSVVEITTEAVTTDIYMQQYVQTGAGSGVIISEDGYIVTNNHVIDGAEKITVTTKDGTAYEAKLVGTDSETDVALLKVEATGLKAVVMGNSSDLQVGDTAVVIGNPLGQLGGTVTSGIVSALDRDITLNGNSMSLLQTNAAINPGNSGGGMFNDKGELVGIVVAKSGGTTSDGTTIEGLGFAIPIDDVKEVVQELSTNGYVTGRPSLGVNLVDITNEQTAMMYRVNQLGVYVLKSTNEANNLQAGDCIVSVDGTAVSSADEVKSIIQDHKVGDTLSIVIIREGKTMTVEAALQENKPDTSSNDENTAGGNNGQGSGGQDSQQTPEDSQGGSLRDWLNQFGF